ncbi:MAG: NUDIX domain-containing protein [Bacteroidales bacterium]
MEKNSTYCNYPQCYLAVDCIIFGYENDELKLLLYHRQMPPAKGLWSLMGGFVEENESIEETSKRVLNQTVGLENIFMEQVYVFSSPDRDPGGRVVSVAFYALIPIHSSDKELVDSHGAKWFSINDLPELVFDHRQMVGLALEKLQQTASYKLIGKELLPEQFTLTQLHNLYNSIFQKKFDAGNFRKKISSLNILEKLNFKDTMSSKRGAYYYTFKDANGTLFMERIVKK